jgi:uncharacterized protein (DUF983 family)
MPWTSEVAEERSVKRAMLRGAACRCPNCGKGRLFTGFITVVDRCEACGEDLSHQRADDAPPYFVIFIVGHVVVALVLMVERAYAPSLWVHMALWLPLTLVLSLVLLPPIKGAVVGLQWAHRMHGFGGSEE